MPCSRVVSTDVHVYALRHAAGLLPARHLWYRIYVDNYGQPDPEQLLPLPGQPPKDYAPPTGLNYTPGGRDGASSRQRSAAVCWVQHKLFERYDISCPCTALGLCSRNT
jgi:hypothetical protein